MSWSFSLARPVARADFEAAVDAAEVTGQDIELPGVREDVEAAKAAVKALAQRLRRDWIGASASGHCLQRDEGDGMSDSIAVNVYGANPPQDAAP